MTAMIPADTGVMAVSYCYSLSTLCTVVTYTQLMTAMIPADTGVMAVSYCYSLSTLCTVVTYTYSVMHSKDICSNVNGNKLS